MAKKFCRPLVSLAAYDAAIGHPHTRKTLESAPSLLLEVIQPTGIPALAARFTKLKQRFNKGTERMSAVATDGTASHSHSKHLHRADNTGYTGRTTNHKAEILPRQRGFFMPVVFGIRRFHWRDGRPEYNTRKGNKVSVLCDVVESRRPLSRLSEWVAFTKHKGAIMVISQSASAPVCLSSAETPVSAMPGVRS